MLNEEMNSLFNAIGSNDKDAVSALLLNEDLDLDGTNEQGLTPLLLAIEYGHDEIVELLLQHGGHTPSYKYKEPQGNVATYGQQKFWFFEKLLDSKTAYNVALAYKIYGNVDKIVFAKSLECMLEQHAILRTYFEYQEGLLLQLLASKESLSFEYVDLTNIDKVTKRYDELNEALSTFSQAIFDLAHAPLIKFKLFKISDQEYLFCLVAHHAVIDGFSVGILLRDLFQTYQAMVQGKTPILVRSSWSYQDYARYQLGMIKEKGYEQHILYWQQYLMDAPEKINFPLDRPRPPKQTHHGACYTIEIDSARVEVLRKIAYENASSFYSVLLSMYFILLGKYSGDKDIVVGTVFANRNLPEVAHTVGFFVNTIPIRALLDFNLTFSKFLTTFSLQVAESFKHADVPYEYVLSQLNIRRDLQVNPLFQMAFVMQSDSYLSFSDIVGSEVKQLEAYEIARTSSLFDVTLEATLIAGKLRLVFEYNQDLFNITTIANIADCYVNIINEVVTLADKKIGSFQLLSLQKQEQQLVLWNNTQQDEFKNGCLLNSFVAQVEKTPDHPGLIYEDVVYSYRQLLQRILSFSRQIEIRLSEVNLQSNIVAICMERGAGMAIAIWAIWFAKKAYLPIDIDAPAERIKFLLKDAGCHLIIADSSTAPRLAACSFETVLNYDVIEFTNENSFTSATPELRVLSSDLAYVIYTSGTTGVPKGVMIEHGALFNRIQWMQDRFPLNHEDRVLQKTPYTFDVSVWEFTWPLISGAALVMAAPHGHKDPKYLSQVIAQQHISVIHFVPSMFEVFLEQAAREELTSLRLVFSSGEALPTKVANKFLKNFPRCKLYNLYGPTEAAVDVTCWECAEDDDKVFKSVPIGRPIYNVVTYVLDECLMPLPVGVYGELCIGGICLARGYLNRPELTEEKFVVSPFDSTQRLYKTGDLVRYLPDGNIEYLMRNDNQVKINGIRIELDEIRATLEKHKEVLTVVVSIATSGSEKYAVAYYTTRDNVEIAASEFVKYLKIYLPTYLIPAFFIRLDRIPVTASGKVDLKKLPSFETFTKQEAHKVEVVLSPTEQTILDVWRLVLGVTSIGRESNFFQVGGHSLNALKVLYKINEIFKINCRIDAIFKHVTVSQLSWHVDELLKSDSWQSESIAKVAREQKHYMLSSSQKRMWFLEKFNLADDGLYNIPVTYRLRGNLDVAALTTALNFMIARHEPLRTKIVNVDGNPYQTVEEFCPLTLPLIKVKAQDLATTMAQEIYRKFMLEDGCLFKIKLFVIGVDEYVLLLIFHHMICDYLSIKIFLDELRECYSAILKNGEPKLKAIPFQYLDYIYWQLNNKNEQKYLEQTKYWQQQLNDYADLNLPTSFSRGSVQTYHGDTHLFHADAKFLATLQLFAKNNGTTVYAVLFAIFSILLHKYSAQKDIVIGTTVIDRWLDQLKGAMGCFINVLPIRCIFADESSYAQYLKTFQHTLLESIENNGVQFEDIVGLLQVKRNTGVSPIFQVMFNFQNTRNDQLYLQGVSAESYPMHYRISKYDMTLYVTEKEDGLSFLFEYNCSLFTSDYIKNFADAYFSLITNILQDPTKTIAKYQFISGSLEQELLTGFHENKNYLTQNLLTELFEKQVNKAPNRVAVSCRDEIITYAELNSRANRLARSLLAERVIIEAESYPLVGICMNRGINMVVAMLAVAKAGLAYIPIDQKYPLDRIKYMLDSVNCRLVVTEASVSSKLQFLVADQYTIFYVDDDKLKDFSAQNLAAKQIVQRELLYAIYTSGSTGDPKVVGVRHQGVINLLYDIIDDLEISQESTFLALTSISFDISALEIYAPLLVGGRVIITDSLTLLKKDVLCQLFAKNSITHIQATPSTWKMILENNEFFTATNLKLLSGGEPLDMVLAQKLLNHGRLWNLYGPTETSIWSVKKEILATDEKISLGRPVANTLLYVLDADLNLVPREVPGELYIGGSGVAAGYLNQEKLTAERFLPNPFSRSLQDEQAKEYLGHIIYKTGDIVKWSADGELLFIGRNDTQVKVSGFRIELEEIEAVLYRNKAIKENVVVVKNRGDEKYLVAYYTTFNSVPILQDELIGYLSSKLPYYFVPAFFVHLEQMPLTLNKKIDRKRLPEVKETTDKKVFADLAKTEVVSILINIWQNVLGAKHVGLDDSFFDLGGHSFLALNLAHAISAEFGVEVPIHAIFNFPTINLFCKNFSLQAEQSSKLPGVVEDASHRYESFPLTEVQYAYWIGKQGIFDLGDVSTHLYAELDYESLDVKKLEKALNSLIARHEMLRAIVLPSGQQQILENVPYYTIATQPLVAGEDKAQEWRGQLSHQIFDSGVWPLFEIRALVMSDRYRLYVSLDALIFDGMSIQLFFNEWKKLYVGTKLPMINLSFRDYIIAYEKIKKTEKYLEHKQYWMAKIDQMPGAPRLPLVLAAAKEGGQVFNRYTRTIPEAIWSEFKKRARANKATPTSALLALYGAVINCWSENSNFIINITMFNRLPLHSQVNNIIGDFTSVELFAYDHEVFFSGAKRFSSFVQGVQKLLLDDLAHNLFSGIEVQREILKGKKEKMVVAPVVLTSTLGLENSDEQPLAETFIGMNYSITQTPQVWLDNKVYEQNGDLVAEWDFVESLFASGVIADMHAAFCSLIEYFAANDWNKTLPKILPQYQCDLIAQANSNQINFPAVCLHELFIEQAIRVPDNCAIITSQQKITYFELYQWTAGITQVVLDSQLTENELIGIFFEKGWEQIAIALGILCSNSAFLPINVTLPIDRIVAVINRAGLKRIFVAEKFIVMLQKELTDRGIQITLLTLPERSANPCELTSVREKTKSLLDKLAYVIFTSGSTGEPKGVAISHMAAMNTILDINSRFFVQEKDRIFALSDLSFDLAIYDIFGILSVGGAIVVPDSDKVKEPGCWLDMVDTFEVSIWNSVPMLVQMLVEYKESMMTMKDMGKTLRLVLMSGDWIPLDLPRKILNEFSNSKIISLGGATEGSIWSIYYPIEKIDPTWDSIPYGKALANQKMYVLNSQMEFCPVNVTGEIYIGGLGVALGYYNDQDKTQKQFVIHPVTKERLYQTGDLGELLNDGNIKFKGRKDTQVKISGYRVELGEIESALLSVGYVKDAAVFTVGDKFDAKKIIACVSFKQLQQESCSLPNSAALEYFPVWTKVLSKAMQEVNQFTKSKDELANISQYFSNLNELYHATICNLLRDFGFYNKGTLLYVDSLMSTIGIVKRYTRWLNRALLLLEERGVLKSREYGVFEIVNDILPYDMPQLFAELFDDTTEPKLYGDEKIKVRYYTENLLKIIREEIHAAEIYAGDKVGEFYQKTFYEPYAIGKTLVKNVVDLLYDKKINILEVGGGYGTFTSCYVESISESVNKLLFTDVSNFFLKKAKEQYQNYSFFDTALLNLDNPDAFYPHAKEKFEIIIAASVLHDTKDIRFTLKLLKKMLADDGVIVIVEQTIFHPYFNFIMGLQQGFDNYEDLNVRGKHPLLSTAQWQDELLAAGYENVVVVNNGSTSSGAIGFDVIVAHNKKTANCDSTYLENLEQVLGEKLPKYMLPAEIHLLDAFPLTDNGKVALDKLRTWFSQEQSFDNRNIILPRTEYEWVVYKVWQEVLGVDKFSIYGNFYDLGGDSLVATQIGSRLNTLFNTIFPLKGIFDNPTVASLTKYIVTRRASVLMKEHDAVTVKDDGTTYPLSYAQKRLWFLYKYEQKSATYNIPLAFRLRGKLRIEALQQAFNQLIDRHEMLRIVFGERDGEGTPFQRLFKNCCLKIQVVDVLAKEVQGLLSIEANRPFELEVWPLFRVGLYRIAEQEHLLFLNQHHIISDGWSLKVLLEELVLLYNAGYEEQDIQLAKLEKQYINFAVWQNHLMTEGVFSYQFDYWQKKLANYQELNLPVDKQRPDVQNFHGKHYYCSISRDVFAAIKKIATQLQVTPFMFLFAGYSILMSRFSNQNDLLLGTVIANRNVKDIENVLGFFVNTIPLRVQLDTKINFKQFLTYIKELCLEAYSNQDLPFEYLVDQLAVDRINSKMPLVQHMFMLQNTSGEFSLNLKQLMVESIDIETASTKFDTTVSLHENDEGGLGGFIEYNTDIYDERTIVNIFTQYASLLESIIASIDNDIRKLADYSLDPSLNRYNVIANSPIVSGPKRDNLISIFKKQVASRPKATALVFEDKLISYRELDVWSDRLAYKIRTKMVKQSPNDTIGLYTRSGFELVVGMLGIIKASCAYLYLDRCLPIEKLIYMLDDSGVNRVVCNDDLVEEVARLFPKIQTVAIDMDGSNDDVKIEEATLDSTAAYVVYPSVNDERPQKIVVSQAEVNSFFDAMLGYLDFNGSDVWISTHPSISDFFMWETWGALLYGEKLIITSLDEATDPEKLHSVVHKQGVTILCQTPSAFYRFQQVDVNSEIRLATLRHIILGYEIPLVTTIMPWFKKYGGNSPTLTSIYGSSEISLPISCRRILKEHILERSGSSLLGKILPYLYPSVFDENLKLVADGCVGELCIEGEIVTSRYINSRVSTKTQFIIEPWLDKSVENTGGVLYKTGGLVRYNVAGELEYIAQIYKQVKYRGHHISLIQIESLLKYYDGISQALVVAKERESSHEAEDLVAYVVLNRDKEEGTKLVQEWGEVYNSIYDKSKDAISDFDIAGWNSSYTREAIPSLEMREWQQNTLDRIIALNPGDIFEIGCGSGLLMLPLLNDVRRYIGTDLSLVAIDKLGVRLRKLGEEKYGLYKLGADELWNLPEVVQELAIADTIILNSVIQYFPHINYLDEVLTKLIDTMQIGSIFLGDIRDYRALEEFYFSIEWFKYKESGKDISGASIIEAVKKASRKERELLIDPTYFAYLAQKNKKVRCVELLPKAGAFDNELNNFRYDVVLHVANPKAKDKGDATSAPEVRKVSWNSHLDLDNLLSQADAALLVENYPNWRILRYFKNYQQIIKGETQRNLSYLVTEDDFDGNCLSLDQLNEVAKKHGYTMKPKLSLMGEFSQVAIDLCFIKVELNLEDRVLRDLSANDISITITKNSLAEFSNNPLSNLWSGSVDKNALREFLSKHLPVHMVPKFYVECEKLPQVENGRLVDMGLLPSQIDDAHNAALGNTEVKFEEERVVLQVWQEVLNASDFGVEDSFFDIGGHSLNALNVIAKLNNIFKINCPVRAIFAYPTVRSLANYIVRSQVVGDFTSNIIIPLSTSGDGAPLYLFHAVGTTAFLYRKLLPYLKEQPVYVIEDPYYSQDHHPFASMDELATFYLEQIIAKQSEGPYQLGGYSFGGILALVIASKMKKRGLAVERLVLFDSFIMKKQHFAQQKEINVEDEINKLILRERGIVLTAHDYQAFERSREVFEKFLVNHKFEPYNGRVILYKARGEEVVEDELLINGLGEYVDPDNLELYTIPGKHLEIFHDNCIVEFGEKVARALTGSDGIKIDAIDKLPIEIRRLICAVQCNDYYLVDRLLLSFTNKPCLDREIYASICAFTKNQELLDRLEKFYKLS